MSFRTFYFTIFVPSPMISVTHFASPRVSLDAPALWSENVDYKCSCRWPWGARAAGPAIAPVRRSRHPVIYSAYCHCVLTAKYINLNSIMHCSDGARQTARELSSCVVIDRGWKPTREIGWATRALSSLTAALVRCGNGAGYDSLVCHPPVECLRLKGLCWSSSLIIRFEESRKLDRRCHGIGSLFVLVYLKSMSC